MPTTTLFHSLARHFWFKSAYLALTEPVPAKIRNRAGQALDRDSRPRDPPHVVSWVDDERLLIEGADGPRPATVCGRRRSCSEPVS